MTEHEQALRQKEREALRVIAAKLGISEEEALRQAIQIMENRIAAWQKMITARLAKAASPIVPEDEES